jgi:hypothetical protein
MTTAVAQPPAGSLTAERLTLLARTFEEALQPVWIEDNAGHCLYRNAPAARNNRRSGDMVLEIVDHQGRLVGRLRTLPG